MFNLLTDIMNFDIDSIKENHKKHIEFTHLLINNNVYWSAKGEKRGCEVRLISGNRIIYLVYPQHIKEYESDKNNKDNFILSYPDQDDFYENLKQFISDTKIKIKPWIDAIVENKKIPLNMLGKHINNKTAVLTLGNSINDFKPDTNDFSNYIIEREIINPLCQGQREELERLKRCKECNKLFFNKDIRKIFCSDECKYKNFYKNKKLN